MVFWITYFGLLYVTKKLLTAKGQNELDEAAAKLRAKREKESNRNGV